MNAPTKAIEEAHLAALRARRDVGIADDPDAPRRDSKGQPVGRPPHEELQRAVASYYEALRSYLVSTPEGLRFYQGQAPDNPDELGYGVLERRTRTLSDPIEDFPDPPEDVTTLETEKFYEDVVEELLRDNQVLLRPVNIETDDDQKVVRARIEECKTGLSHLDSMYSQRETIEPEKPSGFMKRSGGSFFGRSGSQEDNKQKRVILQPLELLMNAARELDRAASELDLLAETKDSDVKPYMRDFDASRNGEAEAELSKTELSGSPDM